MKKIKTIKNNIKYAIYCPILLLLTLAIAYIAITNNPSETTQKTNLKSDIDRPGKVSGNNEKVEEKATVEASTNRLIFGQSVDGKNIEGYVLGRGDKTILLIGSIHGNEMGTSELLEKFANMLVLDQKIISEDIKLVIIPTLNPDGYYDRTDKLNANGVNLNLNFPTSYWQLYGPEGNYAGAEPFSEPESNVLRKVVENYSPSALISFHSFGALVNPEIHEKSKILANWYSTKTGYSYFDDPAWDFSGTATKWFVENYDKPAITIELSDHYLSDWEINIEVLIDIAGNKAPIY